MPEPKTKAEHPSNTHDHIRIKIKMPNLSQEPPVSSKSPHKDLEDIEVLWTFKIKIESQNSEYGCLKDHWQYPNQDQDYKPWSETTSVLKRTNPDLLDTYILYSFRIYVDSQIF